ncbi:DUF2207 domain-containing protein [Pullulanibacillus sp. KACC 23026]|uniref:DUF2207 domain-containing protein n=1 Tax=Pullulanibacillus sp. KACC 23026 TaxID=3028315 RepID=UPI0023AF8C5B|nr:DUF2207 domain-containing protein [Pullulanibacillus sp. KACC 23026]WEG14667.1 DUF2207 domain-containing protein [Pullulanibacillus sp. KACC 23026]
MKKLWLLPLTLLLAIGVLGGCDQEKFFTIDQVTINATIQPNGSMSVAELYTYTFHGSYNGTTRTINSDVSDFKAYLVPKGDTTPFISRKEQPLKVEVDDDDDHTYKIYSKTTNDTKQVLYTYKVPNVVKNYKDVGFINYRFFDRDNDTSLNHLTINYRFPNASPSQIHAYLHDYTGKATLEPNRTAFVYSINALPAGASTEIHFLVPATYFSKQPTSNSSMMYSKLKNKEDALQQRLAERSDKLKAFQPILLIGTCGILLITLILFFIRILRRNRRYPELDKFDLAKLDPLYVHYLSNRLRLTNEAVFAKLLSLAKKKVVALAIVPVKEKYTKDKNYPNETIQFSLINENDLCSSDRRLVDWLFTKTDNERPSFSLDDLYGMTEQEKKTKNKSRDYKKKAEQFQRHFDSWKQEEEKESHLQRKNFKAPVPFFSMIALLLTCLVLIAVNHVYAIDAMSATSITILNIALGFFYIFGFFLYSVTNRWKLGFYLFLAAAFISLFFLNDHLTTVISLFFVAVIALLLSYFPSERWLPEKAAELRKIHHWKKSGAEQQSEQPMDEETFKSLLYLSIVLKVSKKFMNGQKSNEVYKRLEQTMPLLKYPDVTDTAFISTYYIYTGSAIGASSPSGGGGVSTGGGGAGAF